MRRIYNSRPWKAAVSLALVALIAVLAIEFLFPGHQHHGMLVAMDIAAIGTLAANLAMGYSLAPYKDVFLRSHAFELIAVIPLWGMLRVAEYDYLLLRLFRTGSHFGLFEDVNWLVDSLRYRMG